MYVVYILPEISWYYYGTTGKLTVEGEISGKLRYRDFDGINHQWDGFLWEWIVCNCLCASAGKFTPKNGNKIAETNISEYILNGMKPICSSI